mmetsp:Transcript_34619/g.83568  ORF Transcript_34619/g.83568 Transcript_34619/m.83568 type:complete len:723 (-) Transcript_34619:94-2262(-)
MRTFVLSMMAGVCMAGNDDSLLEMDTNPVKRIINLLQGLRNKIEAESDSDKELYDKFMCGCDKTTAKLSSDVADGKEELTRLGGRVEELAGSNAQLEAEIKEIQEELADNEKSVEEATKVRNSENKAFTEESTSTKNSIAQLDQAIPALRRGLSSDSFLQTLRSGIATMVSSHTKDYMAQLDEAAQAAPVGGSAQVLGVLDQMRDDMKSNLESMTKDENAAAQAYDDLMRSKGQEIRNAKTQLDEKQAQLASQRQEKSDAEADITATKSALESDQNLLVETKRGCKQRTAEYEASQHDHMMELQAITDTVKMLNDDDTLHLFKKTLPSSSSFVQVATEMHDGRSVAVKKLISRLSQPRRGVLSLLMTGSHTRVHGDKFKSLKKMIENMITDLKKEQKDEDEKRDYCRDEIHSGDDDKKESQQTLDELQQKIAESNSEQGNLQKAIDRIKAEIAEIDTEQKQMTDQRQAENTEFTKTISDMTVASGLLKKAMDRLSQVFGAESLAQTPAKPVAAAPSTASDDADDVSEMLGLSFVQESSEEDMDSGTQVEAELSDALVSQDGAAVATHAQVSSTHSQKAANILNMIQGIMNEIKESQKVAEEEEAAAQSEYDKLMEEGTQARKIKQRDLSSKKGLKSRQKEILNNLKKKKNEETEALAAILDKLEALHGDCDTLLKEYEDRKRVRGSDIDTLRQSINILSGANLLQMHTHVQRVMREFTEDSV